MSGGEIVLVTGGAGFIGSHLALRLLETGRSVRVLDSLEGQVHGNRPPNVQGVEFVRGDVTHGHTLDAALEGVSVVVHFAAAVGVGQSMYEIVRYCRTNVMGTAVLLEAVSKRRGKLLKLIVASSMSIYGEGAYRCQLCDAYRERERTTSDLDAGCWEPLCLKCGTELTPIRTTESKTLAPSSVYAINKRDQEEMCLTVGRAYGIPTLAFRFFNVYGSGQSLNNPYTGVMAIFASRLLANEPPLIFEDGNQTRDFVHVRDIVAACVAGMELEDAADLAINLGTGRATSVLEVAHRLATLLGGPEPQILESYRPGDIRHCVANIRQAQEVLGWEPSTDLTTGLGELASWLAESQGDGSLQRRAVGELERHGLVRRPLR